MFLKFLWVSSGDCDLGEARGLAEGPAKAASLVHATEKVETQSLASMESQAGLSLAVGGPEEFLVTPLG